MATLEQAAQTVLGSCLKARAGERILVIDDHVASPVGSALFDASRELGAEALWMVMLPRSSNGEEPPAPVAAAMREVDVVVAPTSRSLTHTRARRAACEAGARAATMPGVTAAIAERALVLDYEAMAARCHSVATALTAGSLARITSSLGADLSLRIEGRAAVPDTGIIDRPGAYGNLPAGEAFIAPLEGTAEGTLVVDASFAGLGILKEPLTLTIRNGAVAAVAGGPGAAQLEAMLERVGPTGRVLCELGVGTNDRAQVCGVVLEDEKVLGTIHIAFGNNVGFGGTNDVQFHVDGVITRPTLEVDGVVLIHEGSPAFVGTREVLSRPDSTVYPNTQPPTLTRSQR